jgi:hypothetical protein
VCPGYLLYHKRLKEYGIEDKDLNRHKKREKILIIPGPNTIPDPWTMMIIHHDTGVADFTMPGPLGFEDLYLIEKKVTLQS